MIFTLICISIYSYIFINIYKLYIHATSISNPNSKHDNNSSLLMSLRQLPSIMIKKLFMFNESSPELIENYKTENETDGIQNESNSNSNSNCIETIHREGEHFAAVDGKNLLLSGYIHQISDDLDFNDYFCGGFIPNDIIKIASKYYLYNNSMYIPINKITNHIKQEIYSIPYTDNDYAQNDNNNNDILFRNIVHLQQNNDDNEYNENNKTCTNYMLSFGIQLYQMTKQYSSITIKYHVTSSQLRLNWTNIKTYFNNNDISFMPETIIVDLNDNRIQKNKSIKIQCKVKILFHQGI